MFFRRRSRADQADSGLEGESAPTPATGAGSDNTAGGADQGPTVTGTLSVAQNGDQAAAGTQTQTTAARGPWDVSQRAELEGEYVDLGLVKIPAIAGMQIGYQIDQEGILQGLHVTLEDARVGILLFAAARNQDLWDSYYRDHYTQLAKENGYAVSVIESPRGSGLRLQPQQITQTDLPHTLEGYDGPGWMLRVLYEGDIASRPKLLSTFREFIEGMVIERAAGLFAPGDSLPMSAQPVVDPRQIG